MPIIVRLPPKPPQPQPIEKLEVVRRQLGEAIRLFFERRDEIAIHTLASAASQVISDLAVKRGFPGFLRNPNAIRPEARKSWNHALKAAENFFKHADRDHDGTLEFNPLQTQFVIFEAALVLHQVTSKPTAESSVYFVWMILQNPDILLDSPVKNAILAYARSADLKPEQFARFRSLIDLAVDNIPDFMSMDGPTA